MINRESPALKIMDLLKQEGAQVQLQRPPHSQMRRDAALSPFRSGLDAPDRGAPSEKPTWCSW